MPLLLLALLSIPDAVYLRHSVALDLTAQDSSYTETTTETIVPMTAQGVHRYSEISATYRNTWESLEIQAEVSHWRPGRGDEAAQLLDEPHSSLIRSGRLESTLREILIRFPGLEIGDTLKVSITRRIERLPLADLYSYVFYAASRDSVGRSVLRVISSPHRDLFISACGTAKDSSWTDAHGNDIRSWYFGPQRAAGDLPFSPSVLFTGPRVCVARQPAEETSRQLYEALVRDFIGDCPEVADSMIMRIGSDPRTLSHWVADSIQYIGADWGEYPGYSPRSPLETLNDRSGVCRDKALLLLWLLERAGYHPTCVLTSISGRPGPYPGSRSFDHMLVGLSQADGDTMFLDPTNPMLAYGYTYMLRGRDYLPLSPEGSPMREFPEAGPGDTLDIEVTAGLEAARGIITGRLNVTCSGSAAELFRSMISSVPEDDVPVLLQRLFRTLPACTLEVRENRLSGSGNELIIQGDAEWEAGIFTLGEDSVLVLPGISDMDLVSSRALMYILPDIRDSLLIETPFVTRMDLALGKIPSGRAILPRSLVTEYYSVSTGLQNDSLMLHERLSLVPLMPSAREVDSIRTSAMACISRRHRTVEFR